MRFPGIRRSQTWSVQFNCKLSQQLRRASQEVVLHDRHQTRRQLLRAFKHAGGIEGGRARNEFCAHNVRSNTLNANLHRRVHHFRRFVHRGRLSDSTSEDLREATVDRRRAWKFGSERLDRTDGGLRELFGRSLLVPKDGSVRHDRSFLCGHGELGLGDLPRAVSAFWRGRESNERPRECCDHHIARVCSELKNYQGASDKVSLVALITTDIKLIRGLLRLIWVISWQLSVDCLDQHFSYCF